MTIIGIDLGTRRTKASVLTTSGEPQILANRNGENFTPSVVYFEKDRPKLVGTEAINAALADPERGVFDFKRHMGTDTVLYTDENGIEFKADDVATIILETIKVDAEAKLGEPINEAVITVPANYSNVQKRQTIEAGAKAGLKVILTPHEPTAGALGNHIHKLKSGIALVYDLGGGTFDVSIIKVNGNVSEVVTTGGIPKLGGCDFNERIKEKALDEFESQHGYRPDKNDHAVFFQDLSGRIEQLKISLTTQKQGSIIVPCNGDLLNMTIDRQQFEDWVRDLVEQTIDQTENILKDANLTWADIDVIYPIGGGAMMPVVTERLETVSGKKVTRNCEAHCAVALGAVVAVQMEYARLNKVIIVGKVTIPPIKPRVRDILSRSIGILALSEDDQEVCSEILAKNTPIPSSEMKVFQLTELNQTDAKFTVLQGKEGQKADECTELGHFELNDLPARPDINGRIEITFDLDVNGMLTASACDNVSHEKAELEIDYNSNK